MNVTRATRRTSQIQKIFHQIVNLAERERERRIRDLCGNDHELREEVMELVRINDASSDPLEHACFKVTNTLWNGRRWSTTTHSWSSELPSVEGYEVLESIANGGQGAVYLALQKSTGQMVAIKVVSKSKLSGDAVQRLIKETTLLAKLQHPNIVTVVDQSISADGNHCLVTRFIEGVPIDQFFSAKDDSSWTEIAQICHTICSAIDSAHSAGIVHRDLKPSNILVDKNDQPYVLDFGLAKNVLSVENNLAMINTMEGQFLGTVAWASPEQIDSSFGPITPQTDIYQLAVVFYQLFNGGKFPYPVNDGVMDSFQRILHHSPAPLNQDQMSVSMRRELNEVFATALEKRPRDRFGGIREFGDAILAAVESNPAGIQIVKRKSYLTPGLISFGVLLVVISSAITSEQLVHSSTTKAQYSGDVTDRETEKKNEQLPKSEVNPKTEGATKPRATVPWTNWVDVNFSQHRAPSLPTCWKSDSNAVINGQQLTIPKGTGVPAVVKANFGPVTGNWITSIEHQIAGNGELGIVLYDDLDHSIGMSIHRGRLEQPKRQTAKTVSMGRRWLVLTRQTDRVIAKMDGARPIYFAADDFRSLVKVEFKLSNRGSGGGDVGIFEVNIKSTDEAIPDSSKNKLGK